MSSSFEFSAEKYAELESDEARAAFKTLMIAVLEADAVKAQANKAKAKADALAAKAKAEALEAKALKIQKEQEEFLMKYPEGYFSSKDSKKVIAVKNEALKARLFVKTFVETADEDVITKVRFSIPKKDKKK